MLQRLVVAALLCAVWSGSVQGLGLGEIRMESGLNQPFSAVIPITSLTAREAEDLRVRMADNEAFELSGLDRIAYLSSIRVEAITGDGNPRIVLRSNQVAREPLLSLLLEVKAGGPRLLREYTVFLDPPPGTAPTPPPAARATPVPAEQPAAQPAVEPAPVALPEDVAGSPAAPDAPEAPEAPEAEFFQTPEEASGGAAPPRAGAGNRFGPVQAGESLSTVAEQIMEASGATDREQVMLGLYEANPGAFLNGNINQLRRGVTLTVPDRASIGAVSPQAASNRVRELIQAAAAAGTAPQSPPDQAPPPVAATDGAQPAPVVDPTQAPAPEVTTAPATAPGVAGTAGTAATPAAPDPAAAAVDPAATPAPPVVDPAPETAAQPAPEAAPEAAPGSVPESAPGTVPGSAPASAPVARTRPAPEPESSWLDWLPLALGGVLLLLIAVVVARSMRERRARREYEAAALATTSRPVPRKGPATVLTKATPVSVRDELEAVNRKLAQQDDDRTVLQDDDRTVLTPDQTREMEAALGTPEPAKPFVGTQTLPTARDKTEFDVTSQFQANTLQIDLGDNDPISEADFHLAYGLYDEAALLLRQAADREPQRTDLPVKLAETWFAAGKPLEFQEAAEGLKGRVDAPTWDKLAIMGRQLCPDAEVFSEPADGTGSAPMALDLVFDDTGTMPAFEPASADAARTVAEPSLNIDEGLDFRLEELELDTVDSQQPGKAVDRGDSLEFDLGEFDLDGTGLSSPRAPVTAPETLDFNLLELAPEVDSIKPMAVSEFDIRLEDVEPEMPGDDPFGESALMDDDNVATKLDLARAYVEMGDAVTARTLLVEVETEGDSDQKREAARLRDRLQG